MAASEEGSISEGNVSVVVRVRPPNQREQESNQQTVVQVVDGSMLVFDPEELDPAGVFAGLRTNDAPKRKGKDLKFVFDHVFGETSRQQEVFEHTTRDILDGVLDGYNCSVFAYGATGAGKTHTMLGSETDPGVMFLTMVQLYRRIDDIKEEKCCEVLISYLEVYNEQIQDLLEPKGFLAIREDPQKGVVVQGLSLHQPKSAEQLLQMLANGNKNRTQHPTDVNATSSRSHAVFQIYVKQQDRAAGINRDLRVAKMSLIDLAGSERASTTNAKGDRQREGANINRSLLALINVINALADSKSKKPHIPYRDSKLTRLLKDSLGGNCRTVMIAAISPSYLSYDDTYNTLKYANRAKEIKLSLKSNVISLDCHISKYAAVCEELKAEVAQLRQRLHTYESGGMSTDAQKVHMEIVQSDISVQEKTHCRLENPPQEIEVTHEDMGINFEQAMSRVRQFNARTSARRLEHTRLSCDATKDLQPSPKYHIRLRSRKAAIHRQATQEGRPSEQYVNQMDRLVSALLQLVRRQQSALRAANLHTPELTTEYEELERVVLQEKGAFCGSDATVLPSQKMIQQPTDGSEQLMGKRYHNIEPSLIQDLRHLDAEVLLPVEIQALPASRTRLSKERARLLDPKQEETDCTARTRPLLKRCRRQRLSDNSPSVESPVVPVKKRRRCKGSPVPPVSLEGPTPGGLQSKPKEKSLFKCPGRGSLNSESITPPACNSCTPLTMPQSSLKKTVLSTPKCTSGGTPKNCPLTKGRVPLATSVIQNSATAQKAPLPFRDLNTTFDLSEEGWCPSAMDKTVTFGPSAFSGWENLACQLRPTDGISKHRPEVAVFAMKGPPVSRSSAPQPLSTVKKSSTQRRRRSISVSTSKSMGGPYSHSRIARLHNSTVKKPTIIAERVTCSPRWQSDRKTRKTAMAIARVSSTAPASRLLHFAPAKSF